MRSAAFERMEPTDPILEHIRVADDLNQLQDTLLSVSDRQELRTRLHSLFLRFARYRNASEWNMAVRLCEAMTIVGWGDNEPLEAIRGFCFNGNPNTCFVNRDGCPRFLDAAWSKRKEGLAIDYSHSRFHKRADSPTDESDIPTSGTGEIQPLKLASQRNWIPKNPIFITRGLANCYDNSKPVIKSLENDLRGTLNERMRPTLYGNALNRIIVNCSFSFYDNDHCKTNYIIANESLRLKQKDFYPALLEMYSAEEIEANGYFLRNRFTIGPFRADSGIQRIGIVFEKEFSDLPCPSQKKVLSDYLITAVSRSAGRLRKKLDYDFDLLVADFTTIVHEWRDRPI